MNAFQVVLYDRSVDSYRRILEHQAESARNKNFAQFTDHDINSYLVYIGYFDVKIQESKLR